MAEFGDKTQLGMITLAASTKKPLSIFLGIILGFTIMEGSAVLIGQALLTMIPFSILKFASGLMFLVIGLIMLKANVRTGLKQPNVKNPFLASSAMVILTELGDKTQIVTIALAARFVEPLAVFLGALSALAFVSGLSIVLANQLSRRVSIDKVKRVSAIIFMVLGILTLVGIL